MTGIVDPGSRARGRAPQSEPTVPPWMAEGWWEHASAWIAEVVRAAGGDEVRNVTTWRASGSSLVVRVEAERSAYFFKAGRLLARQEAPLLAVLHTHFPASFPEVVAFDPLQHWMMTRAIHGRWLFLSSDLACWRSALQRFGAIQRALASHVDDLRAVGCPVVTPWQLLDELEDLLAADARASLPPLLTTRERGRLRAAALHWRELAEEPAIAAAPATLDHADLHPHNVLVTENGCVYLDWEDAAVAHPFFTVLTFLGYVARLLPDMRNATATLRDVYLEAWPGTDRSLLVESFERLRPLACVKFAIGLQRAHAQLGGPESAPGARVRDTIADCLRSALAFHVAPGRAG